MQVLAFYLLKRRKDIYFLSRGTREVHLSLRCLRDRNLCKCSRFPIYFHSIKGFIWEGRTFPDGNHRVEFSEWVFAVRCTYQPPGYSLFRNEIISDCNFSWQRNVLQNLFEIFLPYSSISHPSPRPFPCSHPYVLAFQLCFLWLHCKLDLLLLIWNNLSFL